MIKPIGIKISKNCKNLNEFNNLISDLLTNDTVQQMSQYIQHGDTTTLQHCINVAYYNYRICKKLSWNTRAAARAGLLHDLFLYDWHHYDRHKGELWHGANHPKLALANASKLFSLNMLESEMIEKHMFPVTLSLPRHKETYVIVLVDKYCGLLETVLFRVQIIGHAFLKLKSKMSRKKDISQITE